MTSGQRYFIWGRDCTIREEAAKWLCHFLLRSPLLLEQRAWAQPEGAESTKWCQVLALFVSSLPVASAILAF